MKCKICKNEVFKYTNLQSICIPCAILKAKDKSISNFNKETRRLKISIKKKSKWLDEAETAFRRYIRARDRLYYISKGKFPECISCGTKNTNIQYAAGHFKTKGAYPELRFNENNCYLQCNKRCNKELSGNINGTNDTTGYRRGLLNRFGNRVGNEIINELEAYHPPLNLTIDDIKLMKKDFNSKAKKYEDKIKEYY